MSSTASQLEEGRPALTPEQHANAGGLLAPDRGSACTPWLAVRSSPSIAVSALGPRRERACAVVAEVLLGGQGRVVHRHKADCFDYFCRCPPPSLQRACMCQTAVRILSATSIRFHAFL